MKNVKLYIIVSFLATCFASCNTDAEKAIYKNPGIADVSFTSSVLNKEFALEDGGKLLVTAYRGNAKEAALVPVTITDATNSFTLASPNVSFEAGKNTSTVELHYTYGSLTPGKTYAIKLNLDPTSLSAKEQGSITITGKMKLTFTYIGDGTLTSEFFEDSWKQPVYKANGGVEYYKLKDCYAKDYDILFGLGSDGLVNSFDIQQTGYKHPTYGMVSETFVSSTHVGKTVSLTLKFTVASGSFGNATEVIELP